MDRPAKVSRHGGGGGGFLEIGRREIGSSSPLSFPRRVGASEALVKRMAQYGKLHGHKGCVNTIHFNPSGDLLVSGSDDNCIILWNWACKSKKIIYDSGHTDNVFEALIMPFTEDRTIISSAADCQVRVGHIGDNGVVTTKHLGTHGAFVHKLAIEPGSPHIFYSCGEDGLVQHFDLRSHAPTKLFVCSSFSDNRRPIRLNAIVIDPNNPNYFSVGGYDEYARLYDIRKCQWDASNTSDKPVNTYCPRRLIGSKNVHITGLAYSNTSELLLSYNDELVYLFERGIGLDRKTWAFATENFEKFSQMYVGHRNSQTVKGINFFGPCDDYVVSGSDCGHVYIWKKKGGQLICMMVGDKHIVNCVEPHPYFLFLASSGYDKSIKLWMPTSRRHSPFPKNAEEIMTANKLGRESRARALLSPDVIMHVLRLQRRQGRAYIEQRPSTADLESDEDDDEREAFILGLTDPDTSEEDVKCDVVIVDSDYGSGVAAAVLSSTDHKVVVIKKDNYFTAEDYMGIKGLSLTEMYEGRGLFSSVDGKVSILAGSTDGGGSAMNRWSSKNGRWESHIW
ncbi:hypothetical protein Cni_G10646 [Canna indica]|uniref:Uncharacterized protein n=1 Tax=Canna indica TaxID=4628 RepID=A0AAQ3K4N1_9LILI|nr:hypothetical protein Cni_G10646 [Canna indica]